MILWASRRLAFGGGRRRRARIRRLRGGIIGLALSLVPLTVVVHVAEGMIQGITARYLETGTGHLRLESRLPATPEQSDAAVLSALSAPGVVSALPERQGLGLLRTAAGSSGVQIRGLPADALERDRGLAGYLRLDSGSFDLSQPEFAVLGLGLAQDLGVVPGDEVRILTVRRSGTGSLLPRVSRFQVTGIVSSGYRELDKLWVFVGLDRSRSILPDDSATELVSIKIDDPFVLSNPLISRNEARGNEILQAIHSRISPDWRLSTWFELERSQYMNFLGTKNMLVFIMVIILLVAAVNITSTMINLVAERQQEFAILKAIGASPWTISRIVIIIGCLSGLIGILFGLTAGSLCVLFINEIIHGVERILNLFASPGTEIQIINPEFYLERIPVMLLPGQLALQGGLALLMSLLASLLPALRAAGMRPAALFRRD